MMAMERQEADPDAPLLSRAFYPESVMAVGDDGVDYFVDYALNHPGLDNGATEYVHVPANPHWGDIWIKNKRSKDDIGHMLRAIAQLGACEPSFADTGSTEDFVDIRTIYAAWARRVEDDGWRIATLDKSAQLWFPDDLLANFIDAECDAKLALRLLGRGDPGSIDCGNGVGRFDDIIIASNDQNGHILRSFHEAAASLALMTGNDALAQALLEGMAFRIVQALDGLEGLADPVPYVNEAHLATMMAHGAATGVPLTWREVRFLHARIDQALASYGDTALDPVIASFDAATPDGEYPFEPWGTGFEFVGLAGLLGTCASPCTNPESKPVLDCDMVAAWSP
jgi:hypothetical protein